MTFSPLTDGSLDIRKKAIGREIVVGLFDALENNSISYEELQDTAKTLIQELDAITVDDEFQTWAKNLGSKHAYLASITLNRAKERDPKEAELMNKLSSIINSQ